MDSIPPMEGRATLLKAIPGMVPSLESLPPGCKFSNRCSLAEQECLKEEPMLLEVVPGHFSRCRRWGELAARSEGEAAR
jgi:oligopeptide/dipeptide ABC transporter ATP-binding protein